MSQRYWLGLVLMMLSFSLFCVSCFVCLCEKARACVHVLVCACVCTCLLACVPSTPTSSSSHLAHFITSPHPWLSINELQIGGNEVFHSELAEGGYVSWTKLQGTPDGEVDLKFPLGVGAHVNQNK